MIKEDERLNKVKIAKTKKIRKDANDVAQKSFIYIYIYCQQNLGIKKK